MITKEKTVSVPQAASLCDVTRSTVGYWINTKKLNPESSRQNYSLSAKELFFFLRFIESNIHFQSLVSN